MPIAESNPPDGGRYQTDQKRHENRRRKSDAGIGSHRHQRHTDDEKNECQPDKQDVQRQFVGRLLPAGSFHETYHAIEERAARIGGNADHDSIRQDFGTARHSGSVSTAFADDRRGFARDRRLVDKSDAFNHIAISGNEVACLADHHIALAQGRCGHPLFSAMFCICPDQATRRDLVTHPPERIGLGLAAAFRHRFREVGEHHREPQPDRDPAGEPERRSSGRRGGAKIAHEQCRRQNTADFNDEHDRVPDHQSRRELVHAFTDRGDKDCRIQQRGLFL